MTLAIRKAGGDPAGAGAPYMVFSFGTVSCTKSIGPDRVTKGLRRASRSPTERSTLPTPSRSRMGPWSRSRTVSWNQVTNKAEFAAGVTPCASSGSGPLAALLRVC